MIDAPNGVISVSHDGFCVILKWLKLATAKAMSMVMEIVMCKAKVETTAKAMVEATAKATTNFMAHVTRSMIQSCCNACMDLCVHPFNVCTYASVPGCVDA